MMRRLRSAGWIMACALAVAGAPAANPLGAQSAPGGAEEGDEGALFLLLPSGAQGVAVGRAMTPLTSSESAFWNPAGLAGLDGSRVIITRGEHLVGEATGISALLVRSGAGAVGASYQLLDHGTQDLTDIDGTVRGSITIRNHQALVSGAVELGTRLQAGVNLKVVQFRTTCRGECVGIDAGVSATAYAADLGVQVQPLSRQPLRIGFMLAHLGPRFRVDDAEQADPLPARVRLGASYDVLHRLEEEVMMNVVIEVEDRLLDPGHLSAYFGGEFVAGAEYRVFVRGGYVVGGSQTDGAALGLGLRYERFEFGFARSLARGGLAESEEPVHVTLGLVF